jgi:hypothetical protein
MRHKRQRETRTDAAVRAGDEVDGAQHADEGGLGEDEVRSIDIEYPLVFLCRCDTRVAAGGPIPVIMYATAGRGDAPLQAPEWGASGSLPLRMIFGYQGDGASTDTGKRSFSGSLHGVGGERVRAVEVRYA